MQESVFGADGTLLFFGCVCVAFIPFAVFCLPETKGLSLETILPMFEFHGEETANFMLAADLRCAVDGRTLPLLLKILLFEDWLLNCVNANKLCDLCTGREGFKMFVGGNLQHGSGVRVRKAQHSTGQLRNDP